MLPAEHFSLPFSAFCRRQLLPLSLPPATATHLPYRQGGVYLILGGAKGIGLETAKRLVSLGHEVLLHGRSPEKLKKAKD